MQYDTDSVTMNSQEMNDTIIGSARMVASIFQKLYGRPFENSISKNNLFRNVLSIYSMTGGICVKLLELKVRSLCPV